MCVCVCGGLAEWLCPLHLSGHAQMRWLCGRSRRRQHSFDRMIQGLKLFHMTPLTWLLCLATLYLTVCEDCTGTTRVCDDRGQASLHTKASVCLYLSPLAHRREKEIDARPQWGFLSSSIITFTQRYHILQPSLMKSHLLGFRALIWNIFYVLWQQKCIYV